MEKIKKFLPYGVIIILLIVIAFNRGCQNNTTTTVKETTKIDSTVVDSLTKRIQELESVPAETVKVKIKIPTPINTGETTPDGTEVKEYTTSYSDSLITARWVSVIAGELLKQDFEYVPRAMPVIRETTTRYVTQYRTKTIEKTTTKNVGGFLAVGGSIGFSPQEAVLADVTVRWQTNNGYSYHYRYEPFIDGHLIGVTIPIRIKLNKIF